MKTEMQYSRQGQEVTEGFESCVLLPYQDEAGVWTDGYGNTHGVVPNGPAISQEKAEADLLANVQTAVNAVNRAVTIDTLTQGQFDALVDFTFNEGVHALQTSTLLRYVNAGNFEAADLEFARWNIAGGHVSNGLVRRRKADAAEFAS